MSFQSVVNKRAMEKLAGTWDDIKDTAANAGNYVLDTPPRQMLSDAGDKANAVAGWVSDMPRDARDYITSTDTRPTTQGA